MEVTENLMNVTEKLKLFRNLAFFSQADISKIIDTTQSNYALIEAGKVKPRDVRLEALAPALSINWQWLTDDSKPFVITSDIYFSVLPPPENVSRTIRVHNRKIVEAAAAIKDLLPIFLRAVGFQRLLVFTPSSPMNEFPSFGAKLFCFKVRYDQLFIIKSLHGTITNGLTNRCHELMGPFVEIPMDAYDFRDFDLSHAKLPFILDHFGYNQASMVNMLAKIKEFPPDMRFNIYRQNKQEILTRICAEISRADIPLHEIRAELEKIGRKDLL